MKVEHDAGTGRVRCDDEGLTALVRAPEQVGAVAADERARAALGAVSGAVVAGRVTVGTAERRAEHTFWLAPGAAAFWLAVDDVEGDLVGLPPTHVPGRLAGLVGLGPRRVPPDRPARRPADLELVEDALAPSGLLRTSALTVLEARRAWRLEVRGSLTDPDLERDMTVVDAADGLRLLVGDDLEATDGTFLWRRLTTLLA